MRRSEMDSLKLLESPKKIQMNKRSTLVVPFSEENLKRIEDIEQLQLRVNIN